MTRETLNRLLAARGLAGEAGEEFLRLPDDVILEKVKEAERLLALARAEPSRNA